MAAKCNGVLAIAIFLAPFLHLTSRGASRTSNNANTDGSSRVHTRAAHLFMILVATVVVASMFGAVPSNWLDACCLVVHTLFRGHPSILLDSLWKTHNRNLMAHFMLATRMYQQALYNGTCFIPPAPAPAETPFSGVSFIAFLCVLLLQSNTVYRAHCLSIAFSCFLSQIRTNFYPPSLSFLCIEEESPASIYRVITRSPPDPRKNDKPMS